MEEFNKKETYKGTAWGYEDWVKRLDRGHTVRNVYPESEVYGDVGGVTYVTATWVMNLYSPDELEDHAIHGDPEHEEYLMSGASESDGRAEAWDWLKNEC